MTQSVCPSKTPFESWPQSPPPNEMSDSAERSLSLERNFTIEMWVVIKNGSGWHLRCSMKLHNWVTVADRSFEQDRFRVRDLNHPTSLKLHIYNLHHVEGENMFITLFAAALRLMLGPIGEMSPVILSLCQPPNLNLSGQHYLCSFTEQFCRIIRREPCRVNAFVLWGGNLESLENTTDRQSP